MGPTGASNWACTAYCIGFFALHMLQQREAGRGDTDMAGPVSARREIEGVWGHECRPRQVSRCALRSLRSLRRGGLASASPSSSGNQRQGVLICLWRPRVRRGWGWVRACIGDWWGRGGGGFEIDRVGGGGGHVTGCRQWCH